MNEVIGFLFISGFGILFIYMGGKYVLEHLPILAYCWSLGFIAALVAACWAISSGVLNKAGQPLNDTGKTVLHVAKESVDLVSDAYFIACLLILILAPQILAYIICGLFGRATNVYLFKIATRYAALSFIKTTATGSGIILAFWLMLNVSSLSASLSISNLPEGYTALLSWLPEAVATSVFFLCYRLSQRLYIRLCSLRRTRIKY